MNREKRTRGVRAWLPESLHAQLELFVEQEGNVVSMSDYLHRVIEEHVAMKIVKQKIGRRVGNQ